MTRQSTGIEGLDEVLLGGLPAGRLYLVQGHPGAGKTTLGLQFLMAGVARGERALFVTLSESEAELRQNAEAHGWDLAGVDFLDIRPVVDGSSGEGQYTIFHPADIELAPAIARIHEALDRHRPDRVVFDSLTEIRLLSRDKLRYRRQIAALKNTLIGSGTTAIFLGEGIAGDPDSEVSSVVQGVIELSLARGQEGLTRRFIEVQKLRGSDYREGNHPVRIGRGGLQVFPRLLATEHGHAFTRAAVPTGVATLDEMLGGGLDRGTCTLIAGDPGVGKTTLGLTVIARAAGRGERSVLYTFDEGPAEILFRAETIGLDLGPAVAAGLVRVQKVNPVMLYPDEFAAWIRAEVEERGTRIVMIDSLNGYNQSMPDEKYLGRHMHQLLGYLNRMGVTTILVNEVAAKAGSFSITDHGLSYMSDTAIIIRYFELNGAIHTAIGTLKKRLSDHGRSLRAYQVTGQGIAVGKPLRDLRGILRGEAVRGPWPGEDAGGDHE